MIVHLCPLSFLFFIPNVPQASLPVSVKSFLRRAWFPRWQGGQKWIIGWASLAISMATPPVVGSYWVLLRFAVSPELQITSTFALGSAAKVLHGQYLEVPITISCRFNMLCFNYFSDGSSTTSSWSTWFFFFKRNIPYRWSNRRWCWPFPGHEADLKYAQIGAWYTMQNFDGQPWTRCIVLNVNKDFLLQLVQHVKENTIWVSFMGTATCAFWLI